MTKTMRMSMGNTVEENVLALLRAYPETRVNDMLLFSHYYNAFSYFPAGELPLSDLAYNYKNYGLPCFETIRRARQRVQSCFPALSRKAQKGEGGVEIHIFLQIM